MSKRPIKFLYPFVRQFPIDEVCEQIVRELEKRNWQVPGIETELGECGGGFPYVSHIKSQDFELWFCRIQRAMPGKIYNDIAAIHEVIIPKKELTVFEDESGPTLTIYVGKNWKKDREQFMNSAKVNSKLRKEPRTYLRYSGSFFIDDRSYPSDWTGKRKTYLLHTNDHNREYDPRGKEPKFFSTDEVMDEFKQYLEQVVLKKIISQPITAKNP